MTRRNIVTAFGSLLVALIVSANAVSVGADSPCDGYAPVYCQVEVPGDDTNSIGMGPPATPVHILSATGMGQEHFEEMATTSGQAALYIMPSAPHVLSALGIGQEHFEALSASDPAYMIAPSTPLN